MTMGLRTARLKFCGNDSRTSGYLSMSGELAISLVETVGSRMHVLTSCFPWMMTRIFQARTQWREHLSASSPMSPSQRWRSRLLSLPASSHGPAETLRSLRLQWRAYETMLDALTLFVARQSSNSVGIAKYLFIRERNGTLDCGSSTGAGRSSLEIPRRLSIRSAQNVSLGESTTSLLATSSCSAP